MKKLFTLFAFFCMLSTVQAVVTSVPEIKEDANFAALDQDLQNMTIQDFMDMTPRKYKEATGKKMGVFKSIQLKLAQKVVKKKLKKDRKRKMKMEDDKKRGADIPQVAYIILSIFFLGWLAMGLMDDWTGNNWWLNLILYIILWLPGFIHALIVMGDYY